MYSNVMCNKFKKFENHLDNFKVTCRSVRYLLHDLILYDQNMAYDIIKPGVLTNQQFDRKSRPKRIKRSWAKGYLLVFR
jgi:hypothetical protein